MIEQCGFGKFS